MKKIGKCFLGFCLLMVIFSMAVIGALVGSIAFLGYKAYQEYQVNKFSNKFKAECAGIIILSLVLIGIYSGNADTTNTTETSTVKQEETVNEEKYTTQYLTDQGKQAIKNSKEYDYKVITEWTPLMSDYIDNKVKVSGTVEQLHLDNTMTKFLLNIKDNNTPFPVEIKIPSSNIDVEFKEGDTITVNGRFEGSMTDEYNGEKFSYWTISAYYLEIDNQ